MRQRQGTQAEGGFPARESTAAGGRYHGSGITVRLKPDPTYHALWL